MLVRLTIRDSAQDGAGGATSTTSCLEEQAVTKTSEASVSVFMIFMFNPDGGLTWAIRSAHRLAPGKRIVTTKFKQFIGLWPILQRGSHYGRLVWPDTGAGSRFSYPEPDWLRLMVPLAVRG